MNSTITLTNEQFQILSKYNELRFENENALLNYAIKLVQKEIQKHFELKHSADLYKELYNTDYDLQDLTQSALNDFV
ncbi:MAG: hypothetical protein HY738_02380 [Bacteroidia bacterium]|nr:hypothetical protein [Bacteroidia bacterium]